MSTSLFQTGIRPTIDEHLLKLAAEKRDYGDYWSASSAGYCMRKLIFERLGVPHSTEDDPRKQRVFSAGHVFHSWIQGLTRDAGLSVAQELELQDEKLMVRGHFDDLVLIKKYYSDNGEEAVFGDTEARKIESLILYDYKTVSSRSFSYQKANNNEMSRYHKMQLATYMYMLRKLKWDEFNPYYSVDPTKLCEARILKMDKDALRMDEQQLLWTPKLEKEVYSFWSTLNGYWKKRQIPKCTCADYEGGFMAKEKFNPFYYKDEPCSMDWLIKCKKEGLLNESPK